MTSGIGFVPAAAAYCNSRLPHLAAGSWPAGLQSIRPPNCARSSLDAVKQAENLTTDFEPGQSVRWRGARWRVLGAEEGGFVRLIGISPPVTGIEVSPLLPLEHDDLLPDVQSLPKFEVESTDRSRWRALHRAYLTTMAGGREQLVGLDWGAVAVEPYQLVPLLRVAKTMRPRLLIADDTGLGKTAEAGIILRWLAQRHQAGRILIL